MNKQHTFHSSIIDSLEWQAWVRENELYPKFDVQESVETGWMCARHFEAFVKFSAKQYATSMLLRYRPHLSLNQQQFDALIQQFEA